MVNDTSYLIEVNVVLASLSGSLVYVLTQKKFNRVKQRAFFFVSFIMGIIGADATLELAKFFIPTNFVCERAIGAFLCSALVITVIVKMISYVEVKLSGEK